MKKFFLCLILSLVMVTGVCFVGCQDKPVDTLPPGQEDDANQGGSTGGEGDTGSGEEGSGGNTQGGGEVEQQEFTQVVKDLIDYLTNVKYFTSNETPLTTPIENGVEVVYNKGDFFDDCDLMKDEFNHNYKKFNGYTIEIDIDSRGELVVFTIRVAK